MQSKQGDANRVLEDFRVPAPKFFPARVGGPPIFGGQRPPKVGARALKARVLRKISLCFKNCAKFSKFVAEFFLNFGFPWVRPLNGVLNT